MLSLLCCPFVVLVVSHLGLKGVYLVLIVPVPGHCFPFTFDLFRSMTSIQLFDPSELAWRDSLLVIVQFRPCCSVGRLGPLDLTH